MSVLNFFKHFQILDTKQKLLMLKENLTLSKLKINNLIKTDASVAKHSAKLCDKRMTIVSDSDSDVADEEHVENEVLRQDTVNFKDTIDDGSNNLRSLCNKHYSNTSEDNDIDSDNTDDLENFDDIGLDEFSTTVSSTSGKTEKVKLVANASTSDVSYSACF